MLMAGVFNGNPPKPKHDFIWDVEKVLFYLNYLSMNKILSNRFLLLKFITFLSLTSAERGHEIAYLNVKCMYRGENVFIFHFSKITKSWKRGKSLPKLEFCEFATKRKFCVVFCLLEYLKRWESRRVLAEKDQVKSTETT